METRKERCVLFVDGNNWYHAMKKAGVVNISSLDYSKISKKLVLGRCWKETRYYVGKVSYDPCNTTRYSSQQRFLSRLENSHPKISTHLGRIEKRLEVNPVSKELKDYLLNLKVRLDKDVYQDLLCIAGKSQIDVYIEKAVDVKLAIDMVMMAQRNNFDTAYLLSADGDFTPAVRAASDCGKKIFSASPSPGAKLAEVAYKSIPLSPDWFDDCYSEAGGSPVRPRRPGWQG